MNQHGLIFLACGNSVNYSFFHGGGSLGTVIEKRLLKNNIRVAMLSGQDFL